MKKNLVLALVMALGVSATAFAANPFSDVPAGHWAYASVAKLAAAGVVDGFPDGTFKGNNLMTRYEMAQIVAKALAKGAINPNDQLVSEFSDELDSLGVRVAKLEKKSDNVNITGEARYRYFHSNKKTLGDDGNSSFETDLRTRLTLSGEINDNWHYTSMFENTENFGDDNGATEDNIFRRAYLEGNIGAIGIKAGRYDAYMAEGLVLDTDGDSVNGIQLDLGKGKLSGTAMYGKLIDDTDAKYYGLSMKYSVNPIGIHGGYYRLKSDDLEAEWNTDKPSVWNAGIDGTVGTIGFTADYLKGNTDNLDGDSTGYALGLSWGEADPESPGSMTVFANYYNQPRTTFFAHTTDAAIFDDALTGFKGYGVGVGYTIMKNTVATLQYFDTKEKGGESRKDQRIWSDITITF
ncbi:MAG: S-layer homology domain-containing protein [Acidaminococcaceae bacterium]|nr:S-layer homology domain-containing protein [Acidaminococcaceae bacterium]